MIVYDPLYGQFEIPRFLDRLLATPEVRRLSEIRLLNTLTPSLATLGEIRRYSHTLGVLFLSMQNSYMGYSVDEVKALYASVLLHDTGTPAFAHLFEYLLDEKYSWDHETVIERLMYGQHVAENIASQLFHGRSISYEKVCRSVGVDFDTVVAIISKQHPLSEFLFGSLDLDNLDNVARMGWALGLNTSSSFAVELATQLAVSQSGRVELPASKGREAVHQWLKSRKAAYQVIAFDAPTIAAQAVLSDAIQTVMDSNGFVQDDWTKSDTDLIHYLETNEETSSQIKNEYYGNLPAHVFTVQFEGTLRGLGFDSRSEAREMIEESIARCMARSRPLGYIFVDKGAFSKRVKFFDRRSNEWWSEGEFSESVVFYGFCRSPSDVSPKVKERALERFFEMAGVNTDAIVRREVARST